ncbi:MAG: ABC transporter permease [Anaerolineae bacterium]|nr:ABC transporter permease [Anaerolineae bacterium]
MLIRSLLRRRTRTLLTISGIAIGIAAIVSLVALSKGIVANYSESIGRSGGDLTLQALQGPGQAFTLGTGFDAQVLEDVRRMPEVRSASGMLYTMAAVPGAPFFFVYGYEPDQPAIDHFRIVAGVPLGEERTRRGGKPILLGKVAADKLDRTVGDTVRLEETTFRVVGVYETGVAMEDSGAVVSLDDAQTLAEMPRQVMFVSIQLRNPQRADQFEVRLRRLLPDDVEIAGTEAGSMLREMLELLDSYAWGVALIAALVGGVGMMNTMLMSVFERTREIGVLRAVGWSRWRVLRMILGESLVLGIVGGLLGLGAGAGLTWLAANSPAMAGLTRADIPAALIAQAMSMALLLGITGGLYPAWHAAQLAPIEALHYDGGSAAGPTRRLPIGGMALQSLMRQRTRTILTLLGVGIAVLAMMLIGSIGEGAVNGFNRLMTGSEITAVEADQPDTSLSTIGERDQRRIEALPEVRRVTGLIFSVVSISGDPFFVVTARARTDPALNPRILREGSLLTGRRQCLLGWKAAAQHDKSVGDRIEMLNTQFSVVGIIATGSPFEDTGATIELREAQRLLNKPRQVMAIQIKLENPNRTDAVLAELATMYPELLFSKSAEFTENLPDMQTSRDMIGGIYVLTAIVGAIALMNTMIMSIHERTREIGVLRSVGWTSFMVLRQILAEGLTLTFLSGLLAIGATLILVRVFRALPSMGLYREMFIVTPELVLQGLALCVALGVLGGLYPAWRATRLRPVEALRYE